MATSLPTRFDPSGLSEFEREILSDFQSRRRLFHDFVVETNAQCFACPGCGYPTISERGCYEICLVCDWEDDFQDDDRADEVFGGPNGLKSLTEHRLEFGKKLRKQQSLAGGLIYLMPTEVLCILKTHAAELNAVGNKIPMSATLAHPSVKDYEKVKGGILPLLIKAPDSRIK